MKRRDKVEGPGWRDGTEDKNPEHIKIWCDLMISWKEYWKAIPKTDRYQVPAHLQGLVFLVKDDSPFLPTGSQPLSRRRRRLLQLLLRQQSLPLPHGLNAKSPHRRLRTMPGRLSHRQPQCCFDRLSLPLHHL